MPLLSTSPTYSQSPHLHKPPGRDSSWSSLNSLKRHPHGGSEARPRGATTHLSPAQLAQGAARQKDKFVALPEQEGPDEEETKTVSVEDVPPQEILTEIGPSLFQDLPSPVLIPPGTPLGGTKGRISVYCAAESFDRKALDSVLKQHYSESAVTSYPDVFHLELSKSCSDACDGDVFFFDYGVVACWNLTRPQEHDFVRLVCEVTESEPIPFYQMRVDEFEVHYTSREKPHIQNDTITLHRRSVQDVKSKLAISYAFSQSTKLSTYEVKVMQMVLSTKHLPEELAATGQAHISGGQIAKLIGEVFLQRAAVNLLSSVLDTPEFFWRAPDRYQGLYERICEYLELDARVEVLNTRFQVLQEMLDVLRDHNHNNHSARLEWIVILLIFLCCVLGMVEVAGLFGVLKK